MDPGGVGDLDPEAPRLLVPGVRSGAGDHGAGDERQPSQRRDGNDVTADLRRDRADQQAVVGFTGAVDEHDGVGDEDQRQKHVTLHGGRVQVDEHGDPAEHDLGERLRRRDRATATSGHAAGADTDQRAEHGGDHGDADQSGEQAVDLLDRGVTGRHVDELRATARRPVGAAEPEPVSRTAAP